MDFVDICNRLSEQRHVGAQYSIFLGDLYSNPDYAKKYSGSYAGNVIHLQVTAVQSALIMFCARVWDDGRDTFCIPHAIKHINAVKSDSYGSFVQSLPAVSLVNESRLRVVIDRAMARWTALEASEIRKVVRVVRTEQLAHLTKNSGDRTKHFPAGDFDQHSLTMNNIVEFARESVMLIDDLVWLATGTVFSFDMNRTTFESYCSSFWTNMPVYADCE